MEARAVPDVMLNILGWSFTKCAPLTYNAVPSNDAHLFISPMRVILVHSLGYSKYCQTNSLSDKMMYLFVYGSYAMSMVASEVPAIFLKT